MKFSNESIILERIRKILFEDTWAKYGSEYMSHPYDQEEFEPANLPVVASDLTPNQLAVEKPPVEDEDYIPANSEELSYAAGMLARQVPDGEVDTFYKNLKNELEASIERENDPGEVTPEKESEEADAAELESEREGSGVYANPVEEAKIRKKIRKTLSKLTG